MKRFIVALALLVLAAAPAASQLSVNNSIGFGGPGQGIPTVVSQAVNNSGSGSSGTYTVNLPSSIVSGNLLVCMVSNRGTTGTFTWPGGWDVRADTNVGLSLATRVADGSEGSTISVTGTAARSAYGCLQVSGVNTAAASSGDWLQISQDGATTTSTDPNPPQVTPGSADLRVPVLVIAYYKSQSTTIASAGPSGYDGFQVSKATNDPSLGTAYKGFDLFEIEDPGAFTLGASSQWAAGTIALFGR